MMMIKQIVITFVLMSVVKMTVVVSKPIVHDNLTDYVSLKPTPIKTSNSYTMIDEVHVYENLGVVLEPAGQYLDYSGTVFVPFVYTLPSFIRHDYSICNDTAILLRFQEISLTHIRDILGVKNPRVKRSLVGDLLSVVSGGLGIWNTLEISSLRQLTTQLSEHEEQISRTIGLTQSSMNLAIGRINSLSVLMGDNTQTMNRLLRTMRCMEDTSMSLIAYLATWTTVAPLDFIQAYDGAVSGRVTPELLSGANFKNVLSTHPEMQKTLYAREPSIVYELGRVLLHTVTLEGDNPMLMGVMTFPKLINSKPSPMYNVYNVNFRSNGIDFLTVLPVRVVCKDLGSCWEPKEQHCTRTATRLLCRYGMTPKLNPCLAGLYKNNSESCMYVLRSPDQPRLSYQTAGGVILGASDQEVKIFKGDIQSSYPSTITNPTHPVFVQQSSGMMVLADNNLYSTVITGFEYNITIHSIRPYTPTSGNDTLKLPPQWTPMEQVEEMSVLHTMIKPHMLHISVTLGVISFIGIFFLYTLILWKCMSNPKTYQPVARPVQ